MANTFERCNVEGVRLAPYRNCAVSVWGVGTTDISKVLIKLDQLMTFISKQHEAIVLVVVVVPGGVLPNAGQRKEIEGFLGRWQKYWRAVTYVAEGTDLWSMAARTVMTGLRLVQRRTYATNVFSEVGDGVRWTTEHVVREPGTDAAEAARALERLIEDLRRMP